MKVSRNIRPFDVLLISCLMLGLTPSSAFAERVEMTYVKSNFQSITKSSIMINDGSNHEVRQEVNISEITFSDPRFGTAQEVVYITADEVDGSGRHFGHFIDTHSDGSQCYGEFEGTGSVDAKPDGSWVATWAGTFKYLGGSGICEGMSGSGTYKGGMSSTEPAREEGREVRQF